MPELPEVQTIVNDLNKKIKGLAITDIWTDWPKYFRRSRGGFKNFEKAVKGKRIKKIWRLGKNIIFDLSGDKKILIHQKLTGHLLVGTWNMRHGTWATAVKGSMQERVNDYIHAMFFLSGKKMMALSDLRKFAKILISDKKDFGNLKDIKNIGPDPLIPGFSFKDFKKLITKRRGTIKKVLMDQNVISGIGNIYSDDILFSARIHPLKKTENLDDKELKMIFNSTRKILKKAIKLRGTSISDYRDTAGKAGRYTKARLVYQREGEKCLNKCGSRIKRLKIDGRSAHFCPHCQKSPTLKT